MGRGFGKLGNDSDATIDLRSALRGDMGVTQGEEREAWPLKKITPKFPALVGTRARREGVIKHGRDNMVQKEIYVTAERDKSGHKHGDSIV